MNPPPLVLEAPLYKLIDGLDVRTREEDSAFRWWAEKEMHLLAASCEHETPLVLAVGDERRHATLAVLSLLEHAAQLLSTLQVAKEARPTLDAAATRASARARLCEAAAWLERDRRAMAETVLGEAALVVGQAMEQEHARGRGVVT